MCVCVCVCVCVCTIFLRHQDSSAAGQCMAPSAIGLVVRRQGLCCLCPQQEQEGWLRRTVKCMLDARRQLRKVLNAPHAWPLSLAWLLQAHVMSIHITSDEVEYVHGILGQTLRRAEPSMLGGGLVAKVSDAALGTPVCCLSYHHE